MTKNEICSNDEFEALLSKYDYNFKKGDLVNGVVSGYDSNGALVDIGAKNTASVSYKEAVSDNSPIEQIKDFLASHINFTAINQFIQIIYF